MAELSPADLLAQLTAGADASANPAGGGGAMDAAADLGQDSQESTAGVPDEPELSPAEYRALIKRQAQQIQGSQQEFQRLRQEMVEGKQATQQLMQTLNAITEQAKQVRPSVQEPDFSQDAAYQTFKSRYTKHLNWAPEESDLQDLWKAIRPQQSLTMDSIDQRLTEREQQQQKLQQRRVAVDNWVLQNHPDLQKPELLQKTMEHYLQVQQQGFYDPDPQGLYTRFLPNGQPYDLRVLNDAAFRAERDLMGQRTSQARQEGIQEEATRKEAPTLTGGNTKPPALPPLDPDVKAMMDADPRVRELLETTFGVRDPRALHENVVKLMTGTHRQRRAG